MPKDDVASRDAGTSGFPCSVFEAVDATSDEQYWSLGIWPTLESAVAAFSQSDDPNDFGCHDHEDYEDKCVIEIRERKIGWGGVGLTVHGITFERDYDEQKDAFAWCRKPNIK